MVTNLEEDVFGFVKDQIPVQCRVFDPSDGVKYSHQSLLVLFFVVGFRIQPAFTHGFYFLRKLAASRFG